MEISETKKSNKYAALVTYLIAVICLLLGLFLPLFNGGILALQLPKALNSLTGRELLTFGSDFTLSYNVDFFGLGKASVDLMALTVLLYALVTVLAVIFLIPVGISAKRGGRTADISAYIIETAAVIVLSFYLILALQNYTISEENLTPSVSVSYNMIIALGGALLMLIALSFINKKGSATAKLLLFLLSAVSLIALYDITVVVPALSEPLSKFWESSKIFPLFFGGEGMSASGISGVNSLFEHNFTDVLSLLPDAKTKAAIVILSVAGLVTILNYFIDVTGLATNSKRGGLLFNIIRYGLELAALISLIITVAVCKYNFGLLLIVVSAVALIQLLISVIRFILDAKKAKAAADDEDELVTYVKPVKQPKQLVSPPEDYVKPVKSIETKPEPIDVETVESEGEYVHKPEPEYNIRSNYNGQSVAPVQEIKPVAEVKAVQETIPMDDIAVNETVAELETDPEPELKDDGAIQQSIPLPEEQPEPQPVIRQPASQPEPQPVIRQPAPQPEPQPVRQQIYRPVLPEDAQTKVYTINTIYGGPTDEFIRKLTNDEKIEFAMTFIERSKGPVGNIPEYKIGGNNKAFFSSVFIYLGRVRGLISESLLNKMYKELNMM